MASSRNNWLGFSLSPQDHHHHDNSVYNSGEISGTAVSSGDCFDMSIDSSLLPLNLAPPFGFLEPFNRNDLKDWSSSTNYNTNGSELSMIVGNDTKPKLENFLGEPGHTFQDNKFNYIDHHDPHYMFQTTSFHPPAHDVVQQENNNNGGNLTLASSSQTLSLSMNTGSQINHPSPAGGGESCSSENKSGGVEEGTKKSGGTFGQRTSIYRGVTRHRWTGRYEAHLWDNSCRREGQIRKGRQVYLGGYDKEEKAARAYDLAALKYWGTATTTNFPVSNYEKEVEEMKNMTRQEFVASIRRKSSGFSRGASIYRGVTRLKSWKRTTSSSLWQCVHHQHGRWQARIGRVAGNKDLYLGTFYTQEEAAEAYDIAAIKFRGVNAVTNFEINRYDVKAIHESTLPVGGTTRRLKEAEQKAIIMAKTEENSTQQYIWPLDHPLNIQYPYGYNQKLWCKQEPQDSDDAPRDFHQGNTMHDFFHSNLVNFESSSNGHSSSTAHSLMFNSSGGSLIPASGVDQGNQNLGENCENTYNARNMFLFSQQPVMDGRVYYEGSACSNWIPTAVSPALAPSSSTMPWNFN